MFEKKADSSTASEKPQVSSSVLMQPSSEAEEMYAEMKIGKIAQLVLKSLVWSSQQMGIWSDFQPDDYIPEAPWDPNGFHGFLFQTHKKSTESRKNSWQREKTEVL